MPQSRKDRSFFDYLLYTLAGSVFIALTFSFILWLEF
jgi:hypothetical protein